MATTRAVLLAIIENLAREELAADMRMPSTPALEMLANGQGARPATTRPDV